MLTRPMEGPADSRVYPVRTQGDVEAFRRWEAAAPHTPLAVDTETTGLRHYDPSFRVRLVQVGDVRDAWVFEVEEGGPGLQALQEALSRPGRPLLAHNATFDLLALERASLGDLDALYPRTWDTRTLAHLLDPRTRHEGGTGHGLKELAAHHLGADLAEGEKALKAAFRQAGLKVSEGFAQLDIRHPDLVLYGGLDAIMVARLYPILSALVKEQTHGPALAVFERKVAHLCARMQRRGIALDIHYARGLAEELRLESEHAARRCAQLGLENVHAPLQVASALQGLGVELTETTPSGQPKVDKMVLRQVVAQGGDSTAAMLAQDILLAKESVKMAATYLEAPLEALGSDGRVHASIHPLQARTARMSISDPPLQQLPSGDWRIRRAFQADPGHHLVSVDYSQVEMRVLAALSGDKNLTGVFERGEDIHDATATALFGPSFTKAQRKLAKNVGFGKVYGGGAAHLARQAGVELADAQRAVGAYDRAYPGVKRYGRHLMEQAEHGRRAVVTPSGRILPLDRDRLYSATNYVVQSTARDVLAEALLSIHAAGLEDDLLLPVHDEVVAQAPAADAEDYARALGEAMTMDIRGVKLTTDSEVLGPTWGVAP